MFLRIDKITIDLPTLFSFVILKVALDLAYFFVISPLYGYQGLITRFDTFRIIESFILLILVYLFLPKNFEKVSNLLFSILMLVSYIPLLTFYQFSGQAREFLYFSIAFWLIGAFFLKVIPDLELPKLSPEVWDISKWLGALFILVTSVILLSKFDFSFNLNFIPNEVYTTRFEFQTGLSTTIAYLFNWTAFVFNPFLIGYLFIKRKKLLVVLPVILQVFLFSVTGLKAYVFIIPLIIFLVFVSRLKRPIMVTAIFITLAIIFEVILAFTLDGEGGFLFLISRRALLVPAQLSFYYHHFFSSEPALWLSIHRIFGSLIEYPYALPMPRIIGGFYFKDPFVNATNGIVSDAFVNFHYLGLIIWPFITAFYFKLVDAVSVNRVVTLCTVGISVYILVNAALLTSFLTHGLLLALLVLYFYSAGYEE